MNSHALGGGVGKKWPFIVSGLIQPRAMETNQFIENVQGHG